MFRQPFFFVCTFMSGKYFVQTQKKPLRIWLQMNIKSLLQFFAFHWLNQTGLAKKANLKTYKKLEYSLCVRKKKSDEFFQFVLWRIMHVRMMI